MTEIITNRQKNNNINDYTTFNNCLCYIIKLKSSYAIEKAKIIPPISICDIFPFFNWINLCWIFYPKGFTLELSFSRFYIPVEFDNCVQYYSIEPMSVEG